MEDFDTKDGHHPANQGNNDDAHNDWHGSPADCGQDLAADNAVNGSVSNHDDNV